MAWQYERPSRWGTGRACPVAYLLVTYLNATARRCDVKSTRTCIAELLVCFPRGTRQA